MAQVTNIHGYNISHNGDVPNGLRYIEDYWETEMVKDIFRDARDVKMQGSNLGHEFEINGYRYTLFHDGDYQYFLKAR